MALTLDKNMEADQQAREPSKPESVEGLTGVELLAPEPAEELVQLFKLLSDETRLQILHILRQYTEVNVLTLCKLLGLRQPSVSHHLALLRLHRLIEMRREGKHNYYRIQPQRIAELVDLFATTSMDGARRIRLGGNLSYELGLRHE